jgi:hypothetical protein
MFMTLGFHDLDMWEDEIIGEVDEATKEGRAGFTGDEMEKYAFKVPPLYNLIDTTVFGHGASFTSVEDVVRYKVAAVPQHPEVEITDLDYRFAALDLTEEEVTNLVMFLEKSLHDPDLMRYVPMMKNHDVTYDVMTMDNNIEVMTLAKKSFIDRVKRKSSKQSHYIDVRIEQLTLERDNPNNSEEDSNWYNRIIQELNWVKQQIIK